MPKLTHDDLRILGQLLGYPLDNRGCCRGFTGLLVQAILVGEETRFFKRLELITKYNGKFDLLQKEIEKAKTKAKENPKALKEEDWDFLEILSFYEGIELYLNPHRHTDIFNQKNIFQEHISTIFLSARSKKLEQGSLITLLDKCYGFDRVSLEKYLQDLSVLLSQASSPIAVPLNSGSHSICIKYNPKQKTWLCVDVNDFKRFPDQPYMRELSTKDLTNAIFRSFFNKKLNYSIFSTTLLTSKPQSASWEAKAKEFNSKYAIKPEHARMYDKYNMGLLYRASQSGNLDAVLALLKLPKIRVNKTESQRGETPLHIACQNGHLEVVQALLAHPDINVDLVDKDGVTALAIACQEGDLGIVQALLAHKRGINVDLADKYGANALAIAWQKGHQEIVQAFFYFACKTGHLAMVKALLTHPGIQADLPDKDGAIPLFLACQNGHLEVVQALVAYKPDMHVDSAKKNGVTPFYIACQQGKTDIVELLIRSKAGIDILGIRQHTPLQVACLSPETKGKEKLFQLLVDNNANLAHQNEEKQAALDIALATNNEAAINVLLTYAMGKGKSENYLPQSIMSSESIKKATHWCKEQKRDDLLDYLQPIKPSTMPNSFFYVASQAHPTEGEVKDFSNLKNF